MKNRVLEESGMTDKQFSGYLRMLIYSLKDVMKEADIDKKTISWKK